LQRNFTEMQCAGDQRSPAEPGVNLPPHDPVIIVACKLL
jgi:hypothetical protein